jgi:hypothetical protein
MMSKGNSAHINLLGKYTWVSSNYLPLPGEEISKGFLPDHFTKTRHRCSAGILKEWNAASVPLCETMTSKTIFQ